MINNEESFMRVNRYGGFQCISIEEAKSVAKLQKQLESSMFDDGETIEMGKMVKAKEALTIKTTRLPTGTYTMSVRILNVETGKIISAFTSSKTYESAESYVLQAHFDSVTFLLQNLNVSITIAGNQALQKEQAEAEVQAKKNTELAEKNRKAQEAEARAKAEKEAKAKKAREEAEKQNPFANKTYVASIENGSKWDTYKIEFTSQTECVITVTSEDSSGKTATVSKTGSYSYGDEILSVSANMRNQEVRHIQAIHWKSLVTFKNGYNTAYVQIPVSSAQNAKQIRAEFSKR